MKQEVNPIFIAIAVVVALSMTIFVIMRASSPPTPPPGSYTPGVPPWMEKNRTQGQQGVHQVPSAPTGR